MDLFVRATMLAGITVALTLVTLRLARRFNIGGDTAPGVQHFHSHWAPRLGGVPIFLAFAAWLVQSQRAADSLWILCLAPAFLAGLAEDVTRKVGPWTRLVLTMAGTALAWWLLDIRVERLGPDWLDALLPAVPALSFAVTLLFVGGAAHALNIIDGYNGLAASYVMVVLGAVMIVAFRLDDMLVLEIAAGAFAATLGFFVLNFPYGRIFLGDGGAYVLGSIVGFTLVRLTLRHPEVSPMFAAVLLVYPVWETVFSMYRKHVLRGASPMQPDGVHMHMLLYKRLVRSNGNAAKSRKVLMNSATTLYALSFSVGTATAALMFFTRTAPLFLIFWSFIAGYLAVYWSLVRFHAPRGLSMREIWAHSGIQVEQPGMAAAAARRLKTPRSGSKPIPVPVREVAETTK